MSATFAVEHGAATVRPAEAAPAVERVDTPEAAWNAWEPLAEVPRLALDDCLPADARLVVIAPHPYDEVLACGALMSEHAARGGEVLVIAVTDEAGRGALRGRDEESLARARHAESQSGLAQLAPHHVPEVLRLGLPDGAAAHADELEAPLRGALRPTDRVVAPWRLDGDPDHEAAATAAAAACAAAGCRLIEAPVWMWHWAEPGDARVPWQRLRGLALTPETQNRKRLALAAYVSQLVPRDHHAGPVLDDLIVERVEREVEYYLM